MKIINSLKFFLKKLSLKENQYEELIHKAKCFDEMISCVHIKKETEPVYAQNGLGINLIRFDKVVNFIVSVNIINMLKSAGFIFDKSVKWDISIDDN